MGTVEDARVFPTTPDNQLAEESAGISSQPMEVALFDQNGNVIFRFCSKYTKPY